MKTIKAWKVISKQRKSVIVADRNAVAAVYYPVGEKAVATYFKGSVLMAFKTRKLARNFVFENMLRGESKIVRCEVEVGNEPPFLVRAFHLPYLTPSWVNENCVNVWQKLFPPEGTIFCNWIKCLE